MTASAGAVVFFEILVFFGAFCTGTSTFDATLAATL
jgi:hypothetical protein